MSSTVDLFLVELFLIWEGVQPGTSGETAVRKEKERTENADSETGTFR